MNTGRSRLSGWVLSVAAASVGMVGAGGEEPMGSTSAPLRAQPGPIVNIAADGLVECLPTPHRIDETRSKAQLIQGFQALVDRYAAAGAPTLFFNVCYQRTAYPSRVWESYWEVDDPDRNVTGWPRRYWIVHNKGVDPFAVCLAQCRQRGISPWLSIRMNDTHYHDDPTKMSSLWWNHPELRRVRAPQWYCGFDYAQARVREHYAALIRELLTRYDCDGIELDWMRFPWHFRPGEEQRGRRWLNDFMRRVRRLTDESAARRGRPVRVAARLPATPEFARGLGMDGVAWARNGWIDVLIASPEWRPSDTDIPLERWRERLGPANDRVLLVAATDLWLQGVPGGKVMSDDLETQRAFTAAMLDRGADAIYLFNHFNWNDFHRSVRTADGRFVLRDESLALLATAGRLESALQGPRRHVVTFHHPAPPNMPNPKPLPALVTPGRCAMVSLFTGPKPPAGRVVLRVGLEKRPGFGEVRLTARLNGVPCQPIADLTNPAPGRSSPHDGQRVFHVADAADRMLQFEAPLTALQRGRNTVEISLGQGEPQKIVWLEVYLTPGGSPVPRLRTAPPS